MRPIRAAICALFLLSPLPLAGDEEPALTVIDPAALGPDVSFDSVLPGPDPAISGRSLATLVEGQPLFPPIEGLPPEVWENLQCAGCHSWDQATLCTQGRFYLTANAGENLAKAHPFGGGFKATLRRWAAQGCR